MDIPPIFVGGTCTDVGKTHVAAGLVRMLRGMGMNVGVMKPYSAGPHDGTGVSQDARILADAAGISPTPEINPHHQTLEAPPYTGSGAAALHPTRMIERYRRLAADRDVMVVEGMGGLLVPILPDYFMADLARDMGLRTLVVADNAVGTIHHTVSTLLACHHRGTEVAGIVLNMIRDGYGRDMLQDMLRGVTDTPVLATLSHSDRPGILGGVDAGALLGI
ncbi:MAG: dethiobiotin synthase [Nitrosopumilaceae archaeon]|nr:dethiobiotin synthase [Nitrosopumilaceae archaeon]